MRGNPRKLVTVSEGPGKKRQTFSKMFQGLSALMLRLSLLPLGRFGVPTFFLDKPAAMHDFPLYD